MAPIRIKYYYRKLPLLLTTGFLLFGCIQLTDKEFNAFNNDLTLHRNFKIADYDSILIECGNINLTNRYTGEYYQLFPESFEICAKGFDLLVDKVPIPPSVHPEVFARKVHLTNPLELSLLKEKLVFYKADPIELNNAEDGQSINLGDKTGNIRFAEIACSWRSDTLYRHIMFFNSGYDPK